MAETIFLIGFIAVLLVAIFAIRKIKKENSLMKKQLEKIITTEKDRVYEVYERYNPDPKYFIKIK